MSDLIVIVGSILCSAFFSGMEIAFVSSNKLRFEVDKKRKSLSVSILSLFHNHSEQFISTMLVGNNVALVIYGLKMGIMLESLFPAWMLNYTYVVLFIQTVFSTLLILLTAEFLPKIVFRIRPNFSLKRFALPLFLCYVLLFPIAWISMAISKFSLFMFGVKTNNNSNNSFGRIDLSNLVEENYLKGSIDDKLENDIKLFQNALDFSKIKLKNCVVPRTELAAVEINSSLDEVREVFVESGLSKILIYEDNIDHIIGYIHSSSLFYQPENLAACVVDIPFVPESMTANRLLTFFTEKKKTIAVVVDEFGGTSGIVTLEDIIEEIFGEIEDEFDTVGYVSKQVGENVYVLSGRLEIDAVNEKFDLDLPESNDFETIAGLILFHHAKLPKINDIISVGEFTFRIIKASATKIELVRLEQNPNAKP